MDKKHLLRLLTSALSLTNDMDNDNSAADNLDSLEYIAEDLDKASKIVQKEIEALCESALGIDK
jgi:biotin operon repressor